MIVVQYLLPADKQSISHQLRNQAILSYVCTRRTISSHIIWHTSIAASQQRKPQVQLIYIFRQQDKHYSISEEQGQTVVTT
jgi:hypothetical protein